MVLSLVTQKGCLMSKPSNRIETRNINWLEDLEEDPREEYEEHIAFLLWEMEEHHPYKEENAMLTVTSDSEFSDDLDARGYDAWSEKGTYGVLIRFTQEQRILCDHTPWMYNPQTETISHGLFTQAYPIGHVDNAIYNMAPGDKLFDAKGILWGEEGYNVQ